MNETLEELTGRFVGCIETERDTTWRAGDIVNAAVDQLRREVDETTKVFRRRQSGLYKHFASAGGKTVTTAFVRQHAEVSGAFGTEQRYPDVGFAFFRAVVNAAKRTQRDARELLDDALAKALTVADLNALGVEPAAETAMRETCGDCGATTSVKVAQQQGRSFVGLPIACPLCCALKLNDGGDPREAARIGAMT